MLSNLGSLKLDLFADGANLDYLRLLANKSYIKGFTTNPSLMYKAGIRNYEQFALSALEIVENRPISFEVFSDDFAEMIIQATKISRWGNNINVKIPITNSKGESSKLVIKQLSNEGIPLNITAIFTPNQVEQILNFLSKDSNIFISVFAGRIADTGRDPIPIIKEILNLINSAPNIKVIWASPRELLNIFQAESIGCHIITATKDILDKMDLIGKNLEQFSIETVKMFYEDSIASQFKI